MKRRSFFARVLGVVAAGAVPDVVKASPVVEFGDMITLTPVKYSSFDMATDQWSQHIYIVRDVVKRTNPRPQERSEGLG